MNLNIFEYAVICPDCKTKTVMVVAETGLTIFTCSHCGGSIMLHNNKLYSIRREFLKNIMANYRTEECGSIVFTRKHRSPEKFITDEKIKDLKDKLDSSFFVEDFLKNL